ncbi:MAG: hypothetical protein WC454_01410, partial [Phycisphaerae bacterium]
ICRASGVICSSSETAGAPVSVCSFGLEQFRPIVFICLPVNSICYIGCLTTAHKMENSYLHEQIGD